MSQQPIQIELTRSGGFAGQRVRGTFRTDALPPAVAAELTELLDKADLAEAERKATGAQLRPDEFRYELTVARGGDRRQLTLLDHEVPPDLRPLLTRLVQLARQG